MLVPILRVLIACQTGAVTAIEGRRSDRGQSMAEYALLIVGVGALAVFVFKWLQGSGLLENLFSSVFGKLLGG